MKKLFYLIIISVIWGCSGSDKNEKKTSSEVNIYTHRHYEVDQELFRQFEEETGIKVNVVNASADELIQRLATEGENSPADVLITVDAGRLQRALEQGLLQPVNSEKLNQSVDPKFRHPEGYWYALTYRARVIVYAKDRVDPAELNTYEDLADPKWAGKILIRSSGNIYNQSLLASIIAARGPDQARNWAAAVVGNMAREPKGNDRDQVKAVAAGEGDLAVVNTYYIGHLLNSENPEEKKAGESVGIFFPNQEDRGAHINISGAGVTRYAPNKENGLKFIEFLLSEKAQKVFAHANYEYPVLDGIEPHPLLESWGSFKSDTVNLSVLGTNNKSAVIIFDEVAWK